MLKYFLFAFAFLVSPCIYTHENVRIIPDASYFVYEGTTLENLLGTGVPETSQYVSFYTYDGDLIEKIKHNFSFESIESMLDTSARKPQPVKFKIVQQDMVPGNYIIFYDKHNNIIRSVRYAGSKPTTLDCLKELSDELDLSIVVLEQDSPASHSILCSLL